MKPDPQPMVSEKFLHQRFKDTNVCIHCGQSLAQWEFDKECPARRNEKKPKTNVEK